MKTVFAYIRVSTARQGVQGVSLQEQRAAIERYARQHSLHIEEWFEECQTAAKRGRPVFSRMVKELGSKKIGGLVIHKIDRSTRNLKDWADLGELIDQDIEIHLAHEGLDLRSRGGRLAADIQAVIAADYIRNLREETRKGFYGRLKQGLYPRPAPIGYLDVGAGQPKLPDPVRAPLVRQMFELYAAGEFSIRQLAAEMFNRGLRNKTGHRVPANTMADLLKNPFYIGLCYVRTIGETFEGRHAPLVTKALFDRVQDVFRGKAVPRLSKHAFLFRMMLRCHTCRRSLIGELQKGRVYYRCHTEDCHGACVREDVVDAACRRYFSLLMFSEAELNQIREEINLLQGETEQSHVKHRNGMLLRQQQLNLRLQRLTDAFLDGVVDRNVFEERKTALILERRDVAEHIESMDVGSKDLSRVDRVLELASSACLLYEKGLPVEKRELLQIVMSNREVDGKTPIFTLSSPFAEIAKRAELNCGGPSRHTARTHATVQRLVTTLQIALDSSKTALLATRVQQYLARVERVSQSSAA